MFPNGEGALFILHHSHLATATLVKGHCEPVRLNWNCDPLFDPWYRIFPSSTK